MRCRIIPWHTRPRGGLWKIRHRKDLKLFSYKQQSEFKHLQPSSDHCRICRLLDRCNPGYNVSCMTWDPKSVPIRLSKLAFDRAFEIVQLKIRGSERYSAWVIVVSNLSLQAAEGTLKRLMLPGVSFPQVKEYIRACTEEHGESCEPQHRQTPSHLRVIDCERRLVVVAPANCDYVALSYVWGCQPTAEDFTSMRNLPRTIEHSILVTVKLGYKYLWIDRYVGHCALVILRSAKLFQCINQRDQKHRDGQILQMSSIYREAQLTIIAAAGSDPTHGLPGVESNLRDCRVGHHENIDSICLSALRLPSFTSHKYVKDVLGSTWASRAWTYQEGMFSRRRLIFTERQVIF